MTRENKLALVVGFGLLLLVGILVSDHFSPARVEAAGDLRPGGDVGTASQETTWSRNSRGDQEIGTGGPDSDSSDPGTPPEMIPDEAPPIQNENRTGTRSPDPQVVDRDTGGHGASTTTGGNGGGGSGVLAGSIHTVISGDTLEGITVQHYGDRTLVADVARHNRITDPSLIQRGQQIELPPAAVLRGDLAPTTTPAPAPAPQTQPTRPANWYYLVKKDDTLSEIASRQLGATRAWTLIHEMNRDVIPRTTDLREGQRLRMPPRPR